MNDLYDTDYAPDLDGFTRNIHDIEIDAMDDDAPLKGHQITYRPRVDTPDFQIGVVTTTDFDESRTFIVKGVHLIEEDPGHDENFFVPRPIDGMEVETDDPEEARAAIKEFSEKYRNQISDRDPTQPRVQTGAIA